MSSAGWSPNAGFMQQTLHLIQMMNTSTTTDGQRQIMAELDRQSAFAEFPRYLAIIFSKSDASADVGVRLHAGMTMKNVLFKRIGEFRRGGPPPLDPETLDICQKSLLAVLMDEQHMLRQTAGTAISQLVARGGLARWPDLLPNLTRALEQDVTNVNMLCGVMDAFSKLTEDIPWLMIRETPQLLEVLVPKWISLFAHENSLVRNCAASCVNTFIPFDPAPLVLHVNQFLQGLSMLIRDSDKEVRKKACEGIVLLMPRHFPVLLPHLEALILLFAEATQDQNEVLALSASTFWVSLLKMARKHPEVTPVLQKHLSQIVPMLITCMVLSEEEIATMNADMGADDSVADRPEDMAPSFHKDSGGRHGGGGGDGDVDEEEDEGPVDLGSNDDNTFTIRTSASRALDDLAELFGPDITLPIVLPLVEQLLQSNEWVRQECAVLTIGAIAGDVCMPGLVPHRHAFYPLLLRLAGTQGNSNAPPRFEMQKTVAWTLGRFALVVCEDVDPRMKDETLKALLTMMRSPVKLVQRAACSGVAHLVDVAGDLIEDSFGLICQESVHALNRYQARSMAAVLDLVATLFEQMTQDQVKPEYLQVLIPILMAKWQEGQQLADRHRTTFLLIPVVETVRVVMATSGMQAEQFAVPVFERTLDLTKSVLMDIAVASAEADQASDDEDAWDMVERDPLICAMDVLSGLSEGLGNSFELLIRPKLDILMDCLLTAAKDNDTRVRQGALGLIGDLVKTSFLIIQEHVPTFMELLVRALSTETAENSFDPDFASLANNGLWSIGEVALKLGKDMAMYVDVCVEHILELLVTMRGVEDEAVPSVMTNIVVSLGRLSMCAPETVAGRVMNAQPQYAFARWCGGLSHLISEDEDDKNNSYSNSYADEELDVEREDAFKGLCQTVRAAPQMVMQDSNAGHLFLALLKFPNASPALKQEFVHIMSGLRQQMTSQGTWQNMHARLPAHLQARLGKWQV